MLVGLTTFIASLLDGLSVLLLVPTLERFLTSGQWDLSGVQGAIQYLITFLPDMGMKGMMGIIVAFLLLKILVEFSARMLTSVLMLNLQYTWRIKIVEHYFNMNWVDFHRLKQGSVINKVLLQVDQLLNSVDSLVAIFISLIYFMIYAPILFFFSWQGSLAAIGICLLAAGATWIVAKKSLYHSSRTMSEEEALTQLICDDLGGMRVIRGFHLKHQRLGRHRTLNQRIRQQQFKLFWWQNILSPLSELSILAIIISAFGMLALYDLQTITEILPTVVGFLYIYRRFSHIFGSLGDEIINFSESFPEASHVLSFVNSHPYHLKSKEDLMPIVHTKYPVAKYPVALSINHLQLGYHHPILEPFSLQLYQGESIALTGASGSGKSTLIATISGLIKPKSGIISSCLKGEHPIGTVYQRDHIFAGSIFDNIDLGRGFSPDSVRKASMIAEIDHLICQLPKGYQSQIGQLESQLSAGQLARIKIARAIMGNPSLLLFDETFSSIDLPTEEKIINNLRQSLPGTCMIVVCHRPSLFSHVDQVYFIDKGKLKSGTTTIAENG